MAEAALHPDTLEKLLNGDLNAYESVVRDYQPILQGYAAQRLNDWSTAMDIVQLTFIRAWEQIDQYDPERDFGVWLCVICRYFIQTELKRQQRDIHNNRKYNQKHLSTVDAYLNQSLIDQLEEEADPEIQNKSLAICLDKLKQSHRDLIRLRYQSELSCRKIADEMNQSVTWVTSNLSRIRTLLKTCLESGFESNTEPMK